MFKLFQNPMSIFGQTRTTVSSRHALIAPDGHVPSSFPGWKNATAYVLISPAMGADLSQILVTFGIASGSAPFPADEHEHVVFVETGDCEIELAEKSISLTDGGFVFIPWHTSFAITGNEETRVTVFRKASSSHFGFITVTGMPRSFSIFSRICEVEARTIGAERWKFAIIIVCFLRC